MVRSALLVLSSVSSLVAGLSQILPQASIHPWEESQVLLPSKSQVQSSSPLAFRMLAGGEGCGRSRLTGAVRQEGDYWSPDGCNSCRCLAGDRAGCTGHLCEDQVSWEEGRSCSEGSLWEERTAFLTYEEFKSYRTQVCSCEGGKPDCNPLQLISVPPLKLKCLDSEEASHADGFGSSEELGGSICTCQGNRTLDCSEEVIKKASTSQCLNDNSSIPLRRRKLEKVCWQFECNSCRCTGNTLYTCSQTLKYLTWKLCNFGLAVSTNAGPQQCQDRNGEIREAGEEWREDCNSCWCVKNGLRGCTYKRCPVQLSSDGVHSGKNNI